MMRITIMAIGSRGDVQPCIALGLGLQKAGHDVRLVAGDDFEALVNRYGLAFIAPGVNMQEAMAASTNIFHFMNSMTANLLNTCQGEDAIIATALGVSTCGLARERGIPFFYAVPIPSLRTRAFPSPLMPSLPFGGAYNLLTHILLERFVARSYAHSRCLFRLPRPAYLFYFSPNVVSRPPDWEDFAHVTGYWFLDSASDWQPPSALVDFLETGPPPIYLGFGSMMEDNPEQATALMLAALAKSGQRGVLAAGWAKIGQRDLPDSVFLIDSAPHDWLFPHMATAVHHGGAGTTAAALRAGIPSVITPFALDQPFWGRRVKDLGVGTSPIPRKKLTVDNLAQAIHTAVTDEAMRKRAAKLGEKIRAEDGVGNAVKIIERYLDG